jgi:hypothetical protein
MSANQWDYLFVWGLSYFSHFDSIQTSWYTILSWNFGNVHVNCWIIEAATAFVYVCMCVCLCVCVCLPVVCTCVCVRANHKFTVVNVYQLKFLFDNINIVIKPRIVKIKLSTIVHPSRNQAAHHCMLAFCVRVTARTPNVCFSLVSCESFLDVDSERYG